MKLKKRPPSEFFRFSFCGRRKKLYYFHSSVLVNKILYLQVNEDENGGKQYFFA